MKTKIVNVAGVILGALALFGVKPDVTPDQLQELAGGILTAVAIINQVVHYVRDRKPS